MWFITTRKKLPKETDILPITGFQFPRWFFYGQDDPYVLTKHFLGWVLEVLNEWMPFTLWKVSEPPILLLIPDLSCNKMVIGRELPSTLAKDQEVLKKKFYLIHFREREEGRERHWFALPPHSCTHWLVLLCALTEDWTHTTLVYQDDPPPTELPSPDLS